MPRLSHSDRPAWRFVVIAISGAVGGALAYYCYVFQLLAFSPLPTGVAPSVALWPSIALLALQSVVAVAWVPALVGGIALSALTVLAPRLPRFSCTQFAVFSALLVSALSFPLVLVTDRLLSLQLHSRPSFFLAIALSAAIGGALVYGNSRTSNRLGA